MRGNFGGANDALRAISGAELEPTWLRRLKELAHADAAALLDDAAADGGRPPRAASARHHEPEPPVFWCDQQAAAASALAASSAAAAAGGGCAVREPSERNEPAHAALDTTAACWTSSERGAHADALAARADADAAVERTARR